MRGEEVEVELVGVGEVEVFVRDGGVLAVEFEGAGEVCAGWDGAWFLEGCEDRELEEVKRFGVVSGADCPEGEGDGDFFLLAFFGFVVVVVGRGYSDDFAEASACVASFPGVLHLVVETGPDFGFVVLEVGH